MKIKGHMSKWGDRVGFGLFVDFQEWNIWHRYFTIGLSFWCWDIGLTITLWDVEEAVQMLQDHGMTEKEAWEFCDAVRMKLPDPYDKRVSMRKEIEKELAKR